MKNSILIFWSLVMLAAKAQTTIYHPFPDSNAIWNIDYMVHNVTITCGGSSDEFQYSYTLTGDTVINSNTYHKVFIPFVDPIDTCGGFTSLYGKQGYKGCLRQDIPAKKVFFISPDSSTESLLYDFNLQAGDTIRGYLVKNCAPQQTPYVMGIDSVLVGGTFRKRWQLKQMEPIIEGIGCNNGLLEGMCALITSDETRLMCFTRDGTILYPAFPSRCGLITAIKPNKLSNHELHVYPNPTKGSITVDAGNTSIKEIQLADLLGNIVFQKNYPNESKINIENLASGIYSLTIIDNDNGIATKKVISIK